MNDKERKIFVEALKAYGPSAQEMMLLEEMAELQKEICKTWRGRPNLVAIADEMADVEIMLDQMKLLFQNGGLVQQRREYKVDRLQERLMQRVEPKP